MAWNAPAHVIHVVSDEPALAALEREARSGDALVISLDVAGIQDIDALEEALKRVFRFPHPTAGFDAAVDLMSDLEWMPSTSGYFLRVTGLDSASAEVASTVASLMPLIMDRWRTQQVSFVPVLTSSSSRGVVLAALQGSNRHLAEAGSHEWNVTEIAPVPVAVDGVDPGVDGPS